MNKKSFLRGFGLGVLFTAIILGVSFSIRTSESATISRAKKLGMVFESNDQKIALQTPEVPEVSTQPDTSTQPKTSAQPKESAQPTVSAQPKASTQPEATATPQTVKSDNNGTDNKKDFEKEKQKAEKEMEDIKKQLTINDGDWAGKVSSELERLGVIDDAATFDRYLAENGYSNVIRSGTYDVSPEDSYQDLAKKITSNFN